MKLMKLTPTYLAGTFLRCEFRPSQQAHGLLLDSHLTSTCEMQVS